MRARLTTFAAAVAAMLLPLAGMAFTGAGAAHAADTLIYVHSNSMNRNIPVRVLEAAGPGPAPTLYLLDGLRAPDNDNGWLINTDVTKFFANKHVNVVIPYGGGGTFYTDWQNDDPKLGHVRWETFLTKELPPVMKARFHSDGVNNGIAGLSMSGTSALNLAEQHPDFYKAVGSFSGYPTSSFPLFAQGIQLSVAQMGGDATNMWGFWPSGGWFANDPLFGVGNLRGKYVYISSGEGVPGGQNAQDLRVNPASSSFNPVTFVQLVPLETSAGLSNALFLPALAAAGTKGDTVHITPQGIHWWDYWQARLHDSWYRTFAPAFGQK